jgi:hypothetical protein
VLPGLYRRVRDPASDRQNRLAGASPQAKRPNSNMDYDDFTQMNPI